MRAYRAALASICFVLVASACGRSPAPGGQQGAPQIPPTQVQVETARKTPVEEATEYVSALKSLKSTTIQPQVDGQITQIFIKSGDRVKEGAPLVQIDPRRQEAAVSSQEAERAAREANLAFARQQYQRANELFMAGAISRAELEQAETAVQTAEANLKALQAQIQQQQVQLRYYTIAAPTAGVVGDVPVRVGMQVSPSTLITTIDQNDTLEIYISVPVERSSELKVGLPVVVLSSDGEEMLGTTSLTFISPRVDDQTQSILVKGIVQNPNLTLRSAQFVRARVIWRTVPVVTIPVTAVLRINGQYFAFVAEAGEGGKLVARQRAIKVGSIAGPNYPVLEGINEGDRVVVSGAQKLIEGAPIVTGP